MRKIEKAEITDAVASLVQKANYGLPEEILSAIERAKERESGDRAKEVLSILLENTKLAKEKKMPICQDTGVCLFFVEVGEEAKVCNLYSAIDEGVRRGYREGYLRASVVSSPLYRENTEDNTPAVIYTEFTSGDRLKLTLLIRGGGVENASLLRMLKPTDTEDVIFDAVIAHIREKAPFSCPPIIVGIGMGGDSSKAILLSKKAILRGVGFENRDRRIAGLEERLLSAINQLGIGPAALGGTTTALSVNIETSPTHIGTLPLAVSLGCCATRYREVIL
jgi:fumarate hydratase subunit alpha